MREFCPWAGVSGDHKEGGRQGSDAEAACWKTKSVAAMTSTWHCLTIVAMFGFNSWLGQSPLITEEQFCRETRLELLRGVQLVASLAGWGQNVSFRILSLSIYLSTSREGYVVHSSTTIDSSCFGIVFFCVVGRRDFNHIDSNVESCWRVIGESDLSILWSSHRTLQMILHPDP